MHLSRLAVLILIGRVASVKAHAEHSEQQQPLTQPAIERWAATYGAQIDLPFTGPLSFAHLPYTRCLDAPDTALDIALLGLPFDTATTYRPGARFGPTAIRHAARRMRPGRTYTLAWGDDPYTQGASVIDCGDVPATPFDNALAVDQMEAAYATLLARPVINETAPGMAALAELAKDGRAHPRIVRSEKVVPKSDSDHRADNGYSLGGDHTIVLPVLRALNAVYGQIAVIHFDAHLDTWAGYPGATSPQSSVTHGTFFHIAWQEGLLAPNHCVHAGIRCKMAGASDIGHDTDVGFSIVGTEDLDELGTDELAKRIVARVGSKLPVYLSIDIDVIDPGLAPGTGTPEAGGWTTREVKRLLRALARGGFPLVGADIVEVAPAYDNAEVTAIAAADIVHDFLGMMLIGPPKRNVQVSEGKGLRDEL